MELTGKKILIIVENLPVPFDRRVWQEATSLKKFGAEVFIICPKAKNYDKSYELIEGIHVYRHFLITEGKGVFGYILEYSCALFFQFLLTFKIFILVCLL